LVGKHEGKGMLGRPMYRWDDDIKAARKKYDRGAWTGFIWFRAATSARLVDMVVNLLVP
jgi:hypothetical protein